MLHQWIRVIGKKASIAGLPEKTTFKTIADGGGGAGNFETTEIDFTGLSDANDVSGGVYIKVYSDVEVYGNWFNVDGGESEPTDGEVTIWVEIPLNGGDDPNIMSDAFFSALDLVQGGDLQVTDNGGVVETIVTTEADITDANDGGSGFAGDINIIQQGADPGGGGLNDTYFLYNLPAPSDLAFYNNVDGAGIPPGVATTEYPVHFAAGSADTVVAAALQVAMNNVSGITATVLGNLVTATNDEAGVVPDSSDNDTGFIVTTIQQGTDGGTGEPVYTDLSIKNSDDAQNWAWDYDAIYIGKQFPFNNFHLWVETVNTTLEAMKISIWDGNNFIETDDVLDASASVSKNGVVQFIPADNNGWQREDTEDISELESGPKVFDLYWAKITFENPIDIATEIKQLSYLFTDESFLTTLDSDILNYLPSLGKTDFTSYMLMASMQTAIDLKARGIIVDEGQIIQFDDFYVSVAYKTLALIYFSLGPDFEEKRKIAMKEYNANLKTRRLTIDKDMDGRIDQSDMRSSIRTIIR